MTASSGPAGPQRNSGRPGPPSAPLAVHLSPFTVSRLITFPHRHERALAMARVKLARASDLLLRIRNHLGPLRDPADGAREGEDRREHADRNAERLVNDARIEIHVGVEFAAHEILVLERYFLERHRQLEQLVVFQTELIENFVAGRLDQPGARIVVLVDSMPEAVEHGAVVLVLDAQDVFADV